MSTDLLRQFGRERPAAVIVAILDERMIEASIGSTRMTGGRIGARDRVMSASRRVWQSHRGPRPAP
jgi:hypothetical protein